MGAGECVAPSVEFRGHDKLNSLARSEYGKSVWLGDSCSITATRIHIERADGLSYAECPVCAEKWIVFCSDVQTVVLAALQL